MRATAGAIRAGKAFVELFADDSKLISGLNSSRKHLQDFGRDVQRMGTQMMRVATLAAMPLIVGTKVFADFDEQMGKVSTMLDEREKHMERFSAAIRDMAVEFGQSTEVLAGGLYDILSAQVAPEKALDLLRAGAKGAVGGFTDVATSTSALITIMEAYDDQLRDAADASDFLFSVVKRGRVTYEDLAANLGKVAPTAAAAGVSLEEFGAALALITRGMPDPERATTALANVIETFMKNTNEAKDAARKLGIEMSTAGLRSDGLLYVMRQLAKVDPDTVAKVFPRRRALRGLIIAVQKAEELGIDIDTMINRARAGEDAFDKMANRIKQAFRRIWQGSKRALLAVGEALEETLAAWSSRLEEALAGLAEWLRTHKEAILTYGKAVVALAALAATLIAVGVAAKTVAFVLGGLALAIKAVAGAIALVSAAASVGVLWPIVAALATIGLAIHSVGIIAKLAKAPIVELTDEMGRLRREGDKAREQDFQRMARLRELAENEHLSNMQQLEAKRLIGDLTGKYGDLGLAINDTTGAIEGMTDALTLMIDAMRQPARDQLKEEIAEARDNLKKLQTELHSMFGPERSLFMKALTFKVDWARQDELLAKQKEVFAYWKELEARLKDLEGGGRAALTGVEAPAAPGAPKETGGGVSDRAMAMEKDWVRQLRRLKLQGIEDEFERDWQLTNERYEHEMAKAKEAAATQETLDAIRAARAYELAELVIRQMDRMGERYKNIAEENLNLDEQIERARIRLAKDGMEERLALLRVEYDRAIREAKEYGQNEEKIKELFGLRAQDILAEVENAREVGGRMIAGTFSAEVLGGLGMGNSAERTAQASEKTAKNTEKTNDLLREYGFAFS